MKLTQCKFAGVPEFSPTQMSLFFICRCARVSKLEGFWVLGGSTWFSLVCFLSCEYWEELECLWYKEIHKLQFWKSLKILFFKN